MNQMQINDLSPIDINKTYTNRCDSSKSTVHSCIVNIVKDYYSTNILKYSDWIDCTSFDKYYYFIQNSGFADIEVYIEISPNKKIVYRDSDSIVIKCREVSYLQPLRDSRYIRFSYKNLNPAGVNSITSWFQSK